MIERYIVVASRIRQELKSIEQVVNRAERAVAAARQQPKERDLLLDSAALNLHDFYAGIERIERLVQNPRPAFNQVQSELLAFADFLDKLAETA